MQTEEAWVTKIEIKKGDNVLQVVKVVQDELPHSSDIPKEDWPTSGFKLMDGDNLVMFFHWHDEPEVKIVTDFITRKVDQNDPEKIIERAKKVKGGYRRTGYDDVLAVIPDRLEQLGYGEDVTRIITEVTNTFGAG